MQVLFRIATSGIHRKIITVKGEGRMCLRAYHRGCDRGRQKERKTKTEDVIMAKRSSSIFDLSDSIILT